VPPASVIAVPALALQVGMSVRSITRTSCVGGKTPEEHQRSSVPQCGSAPVVPLWVTAGCCATDAGTPINVFTGPAANLSTRPDPIASARPLGFAIAVVGHLPNPNVQHAAPSVGLGSAGRSLGGACSENAPNVAAHENSGKCPVLVVGR